MGDMKIYNRMENVLQAINKKHITLSNDDRKRNHRILDEVIKRIVEMLKHESKLFKFMYLTIFHGGSYYDKLKIGHPEEFDLDVVLRLPDLLIPQVLLSNKDGFVHVRMNDNVESYCKKYKNFKEIKQLLDEKNYLQTNKVLKWFESLTSRVVNLFAINNKITVKTEDGKKDIDVKIRITKQGPAFTLSIQCNTTNFDVDLVPSILFQQEFWPSSPYRKNRTTKKDFLVVPKNPKRIINPTSYWRLSFQSQERELIYKQATMKPVLRLMKKLRDHKNHSQIASYFIKTVFLWMIEEQPFDFWLQPLGFVFMQVLKKYSEMMKTKRIPYYWNDGYNLLEGVKFTTCEHVSKSLEGVIQDVDNNLDDPLAIARHLLTWDEIDEIKKANWNCKDFINIS